MMARCPGCNTHYSLDERKVPSKGAALTCRECGKRWKVTPPREEAAPASPVARPAPAARRAAVSTPAPAATAAERKGSESSGALRNPVSCPRCGHLFVPGSPAAAGSTGRNAAVPAPARRILVVEDQNYFAELTREALGRDYETTVASNLAEARALLTQSSFDLVILDLSLEGDQDGAQVLQATRQRSIPVLVFTARDETEIYGETWEALRSAGATDILIKGMNVGEDLRQKVQALVAPKQG